MPTLGPSPFVWLQVDDNGALTEAGVVAALNTELAKPGVEDLVILAHGWKTDRPGAEALYRKLWNNVVPELAGRDPAKVVVAGVLWPSKAFNADYDGGAALSEAAASGALAAGPAATVPDLPDASFERMLSDVEDLLGAAAGPLIAAARAAAAPNPKDTAAFAFFEAGRTSMGVDETQADAEMKKHAALFRTPDKMSARTLLSSYMRPSAKLTPGAGSASSLGDTIKGAFQGAKNGVAGALNAMTYYKMKERAGTVGKALATTVLPQLTPARPTRLHLVGHSFGARLVTALASNVIDRPALSLRSLTLLQGAFSHSGMTTGKGPFANVPDKVSGPIAMTHTFNDVACSVAYPLASRLSGDTTKRLGDAKDPFGAMGSNGAQVAAGLLAADVATTAFAPVNGKINRFKADAYVLKTPATDAHNNVYNADCGKLVARVITA